MKKVLAFLSGVISIAYLVLETFTVVDIPLIGNLDEATATVVLIAVLKYFGYDLTSFFGKKED